ncbi:alcohol oxidase [Artomyces pyxidatus]|uniref:Alcohol oxidase n=1 Tax=Artomyces pyxidatus TaxID=48021 RepID=A0ACB8STW0_9AGAM|nr:alcohol oxidase [Artomyces pyxidatus]
MSSILPHVRCALILAALSSSALAASRPFGVITNPAQFSQQKFDYLVVGGGTAGLVVAARLTENSKVNVGVIEGGTYRPDDPILNVPQNVVQAIGNPLYDWGFASVPQPALDGRVIASPRGKVLGGSSSVNAFLWARASEGDYDVWDTQFGNGPGWSWNGLLPYFKKTESWSKPPLVLPNQTIPESLIQAHGTNGPLAISYNSYIPQPFVPSIEAAENLGIPFNSDPDSGNFTDVLLPLRSISPHGVRTSSASGYFAPNSGRKNLLVLTGVRASKINTQSKRGSVAATGVQYVANGTTYTASAGKEVILSAGALQTPQLLELSGIGNKTLLKSLNITSVLDLPGVGENLQDQTTVASDWFVKPGVLTIDALRFNSTFQQQQSQLYNTSGTGAYSYFGSPLFPVPPKVFIDPGNLTALTNSLSSLAPKTALQNRQFQILKQDLAAQKIGWGEYTLLPQGGFASLPNENSSYVTAIFTNYLPFSRGSVHINTTDPNAAPIIDPEYFSVPFDLNFNSLATSWVQNWLNAQPLANLVGDRNTPPASVQTQADFDNYVKEAVSSALHPMGTAAMASKALGGVVDNTLKVYGTSNLRVVDASVLPSMIASVLQATVYAIAEKASDIIKAAN